MSKKKIPSIQFVTNVEGDENLQNLCYKLYTSIESSESHEKQKEIAFKILSLKDLDDVSFSILKNQVIMKYD